MFEVRIRLPRSDGDTEGLGIPQTGHNYVVVYGEATHEPTNRLGRDDAERRWIRIPELHATVSVPESLVPEDPACPGGEDLKARKARVSGLQRSGACVIAVLS